MNKEDKMYEIATRRFGGDLSDIQYDWWLSELNATEDDFREIYRKRNKQQFANLAIEFSVIAIVVLSVVFIIL